jgi:hypothetical protein
MDLDRHQNGKSDPETDRHQNDADSQHLAQFTSTKSDLKFNQDYRPNST